MTNWMRLAEQLGTAPDLPGALCKGRPQQFDLPEPLTDHPDVDDHLGAALVECRRCPALQRCAAWVDSLTPKQRPLGVVAGRIITRPLSGSTTTERNAFA